MNIDEPSKLKVIEQQHECLHDLIRFLTFREVDDI